VTNHQAVEPARSAVGASPGRAARPFGRAQRSRVDGARTYRTCLWLRVAVALAAVFWVAMAVALLRAPGTPRTAALGAALFAGFFVASSILYARSSITLTRDGIVAASALRRRPVPFEDILHIVVREGLGGRVYAVFTRRGLIQFTSLSARHRELFETLLERAALTPRTV